MSLMIIIMLLLLEIQVFGKKSQDKNIYAIIFKWLNLSLIMRLIGVILPLLKDFLWRLEHSSDLVLGITSSSPLQFADCLIVLSKYWLDWFFVQTRRKY